MKRWLVILLVALAVIILVSPGIVGRFAEKNLEQDIEWVESESAGIEFQSESFDRGWFTSEGRHRVVLSGATFRERLRNYQNKTGNEDLPTLIIDTHLDHGLIPVASLGRDSGSLMPGLATTVSTFQFDPGNGELVPIPGSLFSNVSLTGATDSRFLLEAGSFEEDEVRVRWQGADIAVRIDRSNGAFAVNGQVDPLSVSDNSDTVHIGAISVSAEQVESAFGFNVGTAKLELDSLVVESSSSPVTVGKVSFSADANIDDVRLNFRSKTAVDGMVVPGMGDMSFVLDVAIEGLDAASMQVIADTFKKAQGAGNPDDALREIFPQIEGDLQKLVSSGAEIHIDQLDMTLPQGKVTTRFTVAVPEGDSGADFSWSSVLLTMTASADIRMPSALLEMAQTMNPQVGALVAMGILIRDGDDYVMAAEYAQGLLNVNDAPFPIPIPGM